MAVTIRTRNVGGGRLHTVHFTLPVGTGASAAAIVELMPRKTGVTYSIESGVINQASGQIWLLSTSKVLQVNWINTSERLVTLNAHGLEGTDLETGTLIGRAVPSTPSLASLGLASYSTTGLTSVQMQLSGVNVTGDGTGGTIALNPEPIYGDLLGNVGLGAYGVAGFTHYTLPAAQGASGKGLAIATASLGTLINGTLQVSEVIDR